LSFTTASTTAVAVTKGDSQGPFNFGLRGSRSAPASPHASPHPLSQAASASGLGSTIGRLKELLA
jgi:hypothetical protein